MTKSNIKLLLVILAVAALGLTYMYVFKPNMEDKDNIKAQADGLEAKYNDLQAKKAHEAEYKQQIADNEVEFGEIIAKFPADLNQETEVMFVKSLDKDQGVYQMDIQNASFTQDSVFYTLGESGYECITNTMPLSYKGSYEGIKDLMVYLMDQDNGFKYRMSVDSVNIAYNEADDTYTGSVNLLQYAIKGEGRTPEKPDVDVPKGVENPFHGGNGAPVNTASANDIDNGSSIETSHDIEVTLMNAGNDAGSGIVVSGTSGSEISSSDNAVVDVDVVVGNDSVTYGIGGDTSEVSLAQDSEVRIFVQSSARVDADDKNGITLNISNTRGVPVYIYVKGDDTASPRFNMGSRDGTVRVY